VQLKIFQFHNLSPFVLPNDCGNRSFIKKVLDIVSKRMIYGNFRIDRRHHCPEELVESGEWRVESGEWRKESGDRRPDTGKQTRTALCGGHIGS